MISEERSKRVLEQLRDIARMRTMVWELEQSQEHMASSDTLLQRAALLFAVSKLVASGKDAREVLDILAEMAKES